MHNWASSKSRIDQWKITPAGFQFTQSYDLDMQLYSISYFSPNGLIVTSDVTNRLRNGQKKFYQIIIEFNENGETNKRGTVIYASSCRPSYFINHSCSQGCYEMKSRSSAEAVVSKDHC